MALISCNTLAELRAHTRLLINEPVGKSGLDNTDDVDRCINMSVRDIARIIRSTDERMYVKKADIVLVSGTEFYDLPDDLIRLILIEYKKTGSQEPDPVPIIDILQKFDVDEMSAFLVANGTKLQIGITPIPQTAYTLQIYYYYTPPLLQDGDYLPDLLLTDFIGAPASEVAMLALTGGIGDWCIRTDTYKVWRLIGADPTQLSNWELLDADTTPPDVPEDYREAIPYCAAVKLNDALNNPVPNIRDGYVAKVDDIRRHFAPLQVQNNRFIGG